jgi:hypothetical protein
MYLSVQPNSAIPTLQGTVQRIDLVAREVSVAVGGVLWTLAVPPSCAVWLNDERVKLRLLQPQDVIEVECGSAGGQTVAGSMRVILSPPIPRAVAIPSRTLAG